MFQLLGLTFPSVEAMDRGAQPPTSPVGRSSHGALVALDFEVFCALLPAQPTPCVHL